MDSTQHPKWLLVATYSVMGFAWAGKSGLTFPEMIIDAMACLILGVIVVFFEAKKIPTYLARFIGVIISCSFIALLSDVLTFFDPPFIVASTAVLPVAAGAMLVEGLCMLNTKAGKAKIKGALMCSAALGFGVYIVSITVGL